MAGPTWATSPAASLRWRIGHGVLTVAIDAPVSGIDAAWVKVQLPRLLASSGATVVVCDLRRLRAPDLSVVDAIARVRVTAGRLGQRVHVHAAPEHLQGLFALTGLPAVAPAGGPSEGLCRRSPMGPPPGALTPGRRTAPGRGGPAGAAPTPDV